jgi:hypothetical protein
MALLEKIAQLFEAEVWDLYEKPPSGSTRKLAKPGESQFGPGKNQRLLFMVKNGILVPPLPRLDFRA